ncbi:Palmitoyltransferase [Borealophlyctis nickersoniae]|nr:Palmitoyltransferase [Borealophlyctis nickersoniae]
MALIALRMRDVIRYQNQVADPFQFSSTGRYFYTPLPTTSEVIIMIINLLILFLLVLFVGILSVWQFLYTARNVTTIESFENSKIDDLVRKGKIPRGTMYPYDLGVVRNLKTVLGPWVWAWFIPQPMRGDGLSFEVSEKAQAAAKEKGVPIEWPPRGYLAYRKNPYGHTPPKQRKEDGRTLDPLLTGSRSHVRRGSEGYVVREWTAEEREEMVRVAKERAQLRVDTNTNNTGPDRIVSQPSRGSPRLPLIQLDSIPDSARRPVPEKDDEESSEEEFSENSYDDDDDDESDYDDDEEEEDGDEGGAAGDGEIESDNEPLGLRHRRNSPEKGPPDGFVDDGAVDAGCMGAENAMSGQVDFSKAEVR